MDDRGGVGGEVVVKLLAVSGEVVLNDDYFLCI